MSPRVGIVYRSQDFTLPHGNQSVKEYHAAQLGDLTDVLGLDYLNVYQSLGPMGFEHYVKKWVTDNEIRILFFITTFWLEFDTELLLWLARRVFIVHWMFDDVLEFDVFSWYYGQFADFVLVEDYVTALRYEQIGVSAQFCTPPESAEMFRPMDLARDQDVSIVGNLATQGRSECVRRLRQEGFAVATFGVDSPGGPVSPERMREIFCRTKVNLNTAGVTPGEITERNPSVAARTQIKGRIIQVALTRSFVLTEHCPGLEHAWGIGTEIGVFHSPTELIDKTRYYLSHDDEREAMATAAYTRALRDHAGPAAFSGILEQVLVRFYDTDWARKRAKTKPAGPGHDIGRLIKAQRLMHFREFMVEHSWRAAYQEMSFAYHEALDARSHRTIMVPRPAACPLVLAALELLDGTVVLPRPSTAWLKRGARAAFRQLRR